MANVTKSSASLPWYNFASTRPNLDLVWQDVRSTLKADGFTDVPIHLDHQSTFRELAINGGILLSQCCGLDLFQPHGRNVVPIGAPVISVLDAPVGFYFSYIVALESTELSGPLRVVINDQCSHSGHTAMKAWLVANDHSRYSIDISGSHARSVYALQTGRADVAAIDALSWRFLDTRGLRTIARSEAAPAPPFVAGAESHIPAERLLAALDIAFRRHGDAIGINRVVPVVRSHYRDLCNEAIRLGM